MLLYGLQAFLFSQHTDIYYIHTVRYSFIQPENISSKTKIFLIICLIWTCEPYSDFFCFIKDLYSKDYFMYTSKNYNK